MKTLCLILMVGLSLSGCSRGPKMSRSERAYYKYLKHSQVARPQRQVRPTEQEKAEMRAMKAPPPSREEVTASAFDAAQSAPQ